MKTRMIYGFAVLAACFIFNAGVLAKEPKLFSENVKRGLDWLVKNQHQSGGWAQGEESAGMGKGMTNLKDTPNVADTCLAVMALMRSGSTPKDGVYAQNIRRGLEYIMKEIEASDDQSLYVTQTRGTRIQMKIGTYIDTFLSSNVLADVKDQMPDPQSNQRVFNALNKVMGKIQRNQKADGTWENKGWATDLAQSTAAKAINKAAQKGVKVDEKVREKTENYARQQYDTGSGKFKTGAGAAGVELYSSGSALSSMQDSVLANEEQKVKIQAQAKEAKTEKERKDAEDTLKRYDQAEKDLGAARKSVVGRMNDQQFVAGFGSNGGEEFLSHLNIGESLFIAGGQEWEQWDKKMSDNINRIQNNDGSWTGHHCITGRTFCTSAALLVLMIDRMPKPLADKIRQK